MSLSTNKEAKTALLKVFKITEFKTYNKRLQKVLWDLKWVLLYNYHETEWTEYHNYTAHFKLEICGMSKIIIFACLATG